MANRCPVCRARLWRRPFARKLRCPRCGAEFRPTVPLALVQLLIMVLLVVIVGLALLLSQPYVWLAVLVLLAVIFLSWFLPRLVRLEVETPGLTVAEGPSEPDLQQDWSEDQEELKSGHLVIVAGALLAAALVLTLVKLLL